MFRPAKFYKFCTAKVAKINLATCRLRLSSPLRFNDPFDCYFSPKFGNLRQNVATLEERHHAILQGEEVLPEGSSAAFNFAPLKGLIAAGTVPPEVIERARKTQKRNAQFVADQFNRESQFDWESMLRRFRVLSLCAEGKNPLLWSHYADCHRGVAFEFDATFKEGLPFDKAEPVKYWKRIPRAYSRNDFIESALGLRPLPDSAKAARPLLMTKSSEWSYEKEWRIVQVAPEEDESLFTDLAFSPRSLSRILFGCRISERNKRAMERLITGDFAHVEILEARQSKTRFALEFTHIR